MDELLSNWKGIAGALMILAGSVSYLWPTKKGGAQSEGKTEPLKADEWSRAEMFQLLDRGVQWFADKQNADGEKALRDAMHALVGCSDRAFPIEVREIKAPITRAAEAE